MSSSYSSLDWVLSHLAHFTLHTAYVLYCKKTEWWDGWRGCVRVKVQTCIMPLPLTISCSSKSTQMSSSYSSLDWVLSHLVRFTLCTAYMMYYYEHGGMDLMGLKPNP